MKIINPFTGKPPCKRCSYVGCPGGLSHFTFIVQLKTQQRIRKFKAWRYQQRYAYIWDSLDNVEVDGIDSRDYPDFCDAFISYAEVRGRPATDRELDYLNEQSDFVYEQAVRRVF